MAEFNIALIPGDGIGPEIVSGAVTVLDAVSKKYGHKFNYQEVYMGGCAIDKYGVPLPQETVDICKKSDSVLLGAVGGPKWDSQPSENRPEKGLLGIRKALELYSNLRPSILKPQLKDASPLKDEKLEKGIYQSQVSRTAPAGDPRRLRCGWRGGGPRRRRRGPRKAAAGRAEGLHRV